jgi:hypothetical protein
VTPVPLPNAVDASWRSWPIDQQEVCPNGMLQEHGGSDGSCARSLNRPMPFIVFR